MYEGREKDSSTDFFHPHNMAWFSLMKIMNN